MYINNFQLCCYIQWIPLKKFPDNKEITSEGGKCLKRVGFKMCAKLVVSLLEN